jgi:hypothetical protein
MRKIFMLVVMLCLLLTSCSSEYEYADSLNDDIYIRDIDDVNKEIMTPITFPTMYNSLKNTNYAIYEMEISEKVNYYICAYVNNSIKDTLDNYPNYSYPGSNWPSLYIYKYYGINCYLKKYYDAWNNRDIKRKDNEIKWIKVNNLSDAKDKDEMLLLYVGEVRTLKVKNLILIKPIFNKRF